MSDESNSIGHEELLQEEKRILDEFRDRYRSRPYSQVFYAPAAGAWAVEGLFESSYYRSARALLQSVLQGTLLEGEGIAAIFLCRHYLELAIKYALFHSRWLRDEHTNASDKDISAIAKSHDLQKLWETFNAEISKRVPAIRREGLDLDFVDCFVQEFDKVDRDNWRFRYPSERIAIGSRPENLSSIGVDFGALLSDLDHAYGVLTGVDSYLVETHGENQEWESIQNTF